MFETHPVKHFCLSCMMKIKQEEALLPKQLCRATCTGNSHQGRTNVAGSISNPLPQTLDLSAQHFLPLCGSFRLSTSLELGLKILSPPRDKDPLWPGFCCPHIFYVTHFLLGQLCCTNTLVLMFSGLVSAQAVSWHFSQLYSYLWPSFSTLLPL